MFPRKVLPFLFRSECGFNRKLQLLLTCHAAFCNDVAVIVRHGDLDGLFRVNFFAIDNQRDLYNLRGLTFKLLLQFLALRTPWHVSEEGIICGFFDGKVSVWHNRTPFILIKCENERNNNYMLSPTLTLYHKFQVCKF